MRAVDALSVQQGDDIERQVFHRIGCGADGALAVTPEIQRDHPVTVPERLDLRRILGAREDLRMAEDERRRARIAVDLIDGYAPRPRSTVPIRPVAITPSPFCAAPPVPSKKAAATRCGSPSL